MTGKERQKIRNDKQRFGITRRAISERRESWLSEQAREREREDLTEFAFSEMMNEIGIM